MRKDLVQQLRDHLANDVDDGRFHYGSYFDEDDVDVTDTTQRPDSCQTVACVAGHAFLLFDLCARGEDLLAQVVGTHLGLDDGAADLLFFANMCRANRAAALRRLDWLLADHDPNDYDLDGEPAACGYAYG